MISFPPRAKRPTCDRISGPSRVERGRLLPAYALDAGLEHTASGDRGKGGLGYGLPMNRRLARESAKDSAAAAHTARPAITDVTLARKKVNPHANDNARICIRAPGNDLGHYDWLRLPARGRRRANNRHRSDRRQVGGHDHPGAR